MNRFRLLEHTADMGIEAEGESLPALFQQAALGLRQILTSCQEIQSREEIILELTAQDQVELLVNWLGELLYLLEVHRFLPASFEVLAINGQSLKARVKGENWVPGRHVLEREIKAITYHQAEVEATDHGWRAQVFVDL